MEDEQVRLADQQPAPGKKGKRSKVRIILGLVLVALVIAFSLIVLISMRQRIEAAEGAEKNLLWRGLQDDYIVCASLLVVALGIAFGIAPARRNIVLRILGGIVWCAALVVTAEAAYLCTKTIIHSKQSEIAPEATHVIVVGTALSEADKQPTEELSHRLDTAADWYENSGRDDALVVICKATDAVIETFNGEDYTQTKAKVNTSMPGRKKRKGSTPETVLVTVMMEKGIPENALVMENQSRNPKEGFEQVLELAALYADVDVGKDVRIDKDTPVIIVTNGCYMNDTVRLAQEVGFTNISRLPAPSTFGEYLNNFLWETWLENDPALQPAET